MLLKNYISKSYPTVHPFDGVHSIEEKLLKKNYLVVIDEDKEFQGILVPGDLIIHPHKIVIDCLTKKEQLSTNDTIISVFDKFNQHQCSVLPVFHENKFVGIIEKDSIIDKLRTKINELYNKSVISQNIKQSFLNNLSHEVRTPLSGLLGFIEIISELDIKNIKAEEADQYNIMIKKSADRFLLIMNDLIDLALINSGEDIKIEREEVWIEGIFADLKKYFETATTVSNRNVSVNYINPYSSFVLLSDAGKIKQILYHLIDNAIKFSNDNKVIFGYEIENSNIMFFVTNNGPQIAEDKKEVIFDAFEKQNIHNNDLVKGLGIGLTLVKSLSELLGGKVDFVTDETNTTFFCTLPLENKKTVSTGGSRRLT